MAVGGCCLPGRLPVSRRHSLFPSTPPRVPKVTLCADLLQGTMAYRAQTRSEFVVKAIVEHGS